MRIKFLLACLVALIMVAPAWCCHRVGFVSSFALVQPFQSYSTVIAPVPVAQPIVQQVVVPQVQQVLPQMAYAPAVTAIAPVAPVVQEQVISSYGASLGVAPAIGYGVNSFGFNGFAYGGVLAPRVFVRPRVAVVAPRAVVARPFVGFGLGFGVVRPVVVAPRAIVAPRAFIRIR